jgi:hypothetical protein
MQRTKKNMERDEYGTDTEAMGSQIKIARLIYA